MIKQKIIKIKFWFLKVLQIQIFLSLISLPILISWGLPISLLSPIGNILFTPVLTLFLFLSSMIFFFEILSIPNGWLITFLDYLTKSWLKLMTYGSNKFLITLPCASIFILFILPFIALMILHNKKTNTLHRSILLSSLALFVFGSILKMHSITNLSELITVEDKKFKITINNNQISLLDECESLTKSSISSSFIEYNLLPYLNKKYGHCKIDILVIKLNRRTTDIIDILLKKTDINHIYFVSNNNIIYSDELKKIIKERNISINFIKDFTSKAF